MSQPSIATQVDEFNVGFNATVGRELAEVFATEQRDLTDRGRPTEAVALGDRVTDARLLTADGAATTLSTELTDPATVLVFYRGAWCPYCNLTLKHYQRELLPALRQRDIGLVAISPQTPEGTEAAVTGGELEFRVLSDEGGVLIRSLGIVTAPSVDARAAHTRLGFDVADSNADGTAAIPVPTVLVLDRDQVVRYADVQVDYTRRTEVDDVLRAVDELLQRTA